MQGQARKEKTSKNPLDEWAIDFEAKEIFEKIREFLDKSDFEFDELLIRPGKIVLRGPIDYEPGVIKDVMREVLYLTESIPKDISRSVNPRGDGVYEVRFKLMELFGDDAGKKLADMLLNKFRYGINRDIIKAIADELKTNQLVTAYLFKVVVFNYNDENGIAPIKWYDELEIHTGEEEGYDEIHGW